MDEHHDSLYFAGVDYNKNVAYSWEKSEWKSAIKSTYDSDLVSRITSASALPSLSVLKKDTDEETAESLDGSIQGLDTSGYPAYRVWIDVPMNVPSQPFKSVAEFFGIWHEIERADYQGVHEFWFRRKKIFLINVRNTKEHIKGIRGEERVWNTKEF